MAGGQLSIMQARFRDKVAAIRALGHIPALMNGYGEVVAYGTLQTQYRRAGAPLKKIVVGAAGKITWADGPNMGGAAFGAGTEPYDLTHYPDRDPLLAQAPVVGAFEDQDTETAEVWAQEDEHEVVPEVQVVPEDETEEDETVEEETKTPWVWIVAGLVALWLMAGKRG